MVVRNIYVSDKEYFLEFLIRDLIKNGISYCLVKESDEVHFDNYIIRFHTRVNETDNLDDLFQIGCLGLVKAIDNFDTKYEVKLSTYACPMIEGEIKRYLRDNNSIRISRSIKDLAYKTLKLKEELSVGEKEPTNKEIADILGVREYDITVALDSLREPVSMYEPIYNDGGDTIYL